MVGKNSWRAGEVAWILKESRTNRNTDELVEKFRIQFPYVERDSLLSGITYVLAHYGKDPSYNHNFTPDEVGFIMEQHFVHHFSLDRILKEFEKTFPQHDWENYVNRRIAIDCVVQKFAWDGSTRCIPFEDDEIRFIIQNRMELKPWERLFEEFQAWKKREDLTVENLQYSFVTHRYKYLNTKQELHNHHQGSMTGLTEKDSPDMERICVVPDSKITRQNSSEIIPAQAYLSAKRKRDAEDIIDENQIKRGRHVSPQPWSHRKGQDKATEYHESSPSSYRSRNLNNKLSHLAVQRESYGSLNEVTDKPQSHSKGTRVQNTRRVKIVLPDDRGRASIPKSKASAIQLQHQRASSNSQYLNGRQYLPGVTPPYDPNYETGSQNYLIPPHIGEPTVGHTHPDQRLIPSSYLPHPSQTGFHEFPPRIASHFANISENQNSHIDYMPQDREQNTPFHWQEQQPVTSDRYLAGPSERSWERYEHKTEYGPIRNDYIPVRHLYPLVGAHRDVPLPNGNFQPDVGSYVPGGNPATLAPAISGGVPISYDLENASTVPHGQCGLSCQNAFDSKATQWMPSVMSSRPPYANHGMSYNPTLPPSPNISQMQAPFSRWQDFIDPALLNDPSNDSHQHQFQGNYLRNGIYAPAQDTNMQPGNFPRQPYNIDTITTANCGENQHSGFNFRSIPTNAIAAPQAAADEFHFSGPDRFLRTFNMPTSEIFQSMEALPMLNQSESMLPCDCDGCQPKTYNSFGQSGHPTLEVSQDLGTTRDLDPSGSAALKEQRDSYLDQQGSSSERPIIIGNEESDNSVSAVEEWDIYNATPLHSLFPPAEEETPIFESCLDVLPARDVPMEEHNASDILQEVAALGEITVSEDDVTRYSAVRELGEVDGGCSTDLPTDGVAT